MGDRFTAGRDGFIAVSLFPSERVLLSRIAKQLDHLVPDGSDAGYARLNMPVFLGDQESSEKWWQKMGGQLDATRNEDRKIFESVIEATHKNLSPADARSFLRFVNQARLVYAARLGIAVAQDFEDVSEEDDVVLWFLSFVVDDLSEELAGLLP